MNECRLRPAGIARPSQQAQGRGDPRTTAPMNARALLLLLLLLAPLGCSSGSGRADFPQAGAALRHRLMASNVRAAGSDADAAADMPPTYITTNPLKALPPLPKVHHLCEGIDPTFLNGPWPHKNWTREDSWGVSTISPQLDFPGMFLRQRALVITAAD